MNEIHACDAPSMTNLATPAESTRALIRRIAAIHKVPPGGIAGGDRSRAAARARHHVAAVLRLTGKKRNSQIARILKIDASTVPYAVGAHLARAGIEHERAASFLRKRERERQRNARHAAARRR